MNARPNIVLVHGAGADGSSWSGVIERLQADGYHVTAPQFPLTALADDVARLRQVLDLQDGQVIVAGHSYGGQVMTALGARTRRTSSAWSTSRRSALIRANHLARCCPRDQ
jgi:pimeloyl-ACP methyl ester carboxylesterase